MALRTYGERTGDRDKKEAQGDRDSQTTQDQGTVPEGALGTSVQLDLDAHLVRLRLRLEVCDEGVSDTDVPRARTTTLRTCRRPE